jgi:tungstate transport system ATP-binding protein
METLYELEGLTKVYNGRTVVDINRLSILENETLAIVGPSGAGKSTLLRLLGFLEKPQSGRMTYAGRACNEMWPDLEARRQVTMVFQRPLMLRRSVFDNISYGLGLRGAADGHEQIEPILKRLGLSPLARESAHTLSGGEMQRVALARALVLNPGVLLLDEPTANLDPQNIKLIEGMIAEAKRDRGATLVMVTHNIFQARRLADRVALMLEGRLIEVADTETFFERPQMVDARLGAQYTTSNHFRGVAQLGRALGLGPRGRQFKSGRPDQNNGELGIVDDQL